MHGGGGQVRRDSRGHRDGRQTVAPVNAGVFQVHLQAVDHLLQRHEVFAGFGIHHHAVHAGPIVPTLAHDDGDQAIVFPVGARRHPVGGELQGFGDVVAADPGRLGAIIGVNRAQDNFRFPPIRAQMAQIVGVGGHHRGGFHGQRPQHAWVGTAEPHLNRRTAAGAEHHAFGPELPVGQHRGAKRIQVCPQGRYLVPRFGADQHMPIGRARLLRLVGQDEAGRSLADEGRHRHHLRPCGQPLLHRVHVCRCPVDIRTLGQGVVDVENGCVGIREELLADLAKADNANGRQRDQKDDDRPAHPQRPAQQPAIGAEENAAIGIALICVRIALDEEIVAKQRRHGDRQHPAQHQRNADHREQGEHELPGGIRAQPDAGKRHHTDDRGAQQRDLCAVADIRRRGARWSPPLHLNLHAFGHNDGVVDQHPHGDDQGAERNPLHLD